MPCLLKGLHVWLTNPRYIEELRRELRKQRVVTKINRLPDQKHRHPRGARGGLRPLPFAGVVASQGLRVARRRSCIGLHCSGREMQWLLFGQLGQRMAVTSTAG